MHLTVFCERALTQPSTENHSISGWFYFFFFSFFFLVFLFCCLSFFFFFSAELKGIELHSSGKDAQMNKCGEKCRRQRWMTDARSNGKYSSPSNCFEFGPFSVGRFCVFVLHSFKCRYPLKSWTCDIRHLIAAVKWKKNEKTMRHDQSRWASKNRCMSSKFNVEFSGATIDVSCNETKY